jgi:3'-phosphoadenosine 5'-phosphosulfate sulfotransferase (PAPS reductase)/FAD synthetase
MHSKEEPTSELLAELQEFSNSFEQSEPEAILAWALARYRDRFTMATAFGPEGMVILEMLSRIDPKCHVYHPGDRPRHFFAVVLCELLDTLAGEVADLPQVFSYAQRFQTRWAKYL